jgi:uridine kinase
MLPFFLIYLFKKKSLKDILIFAGIISGLYVIISFPYLFSQGFYNLAIAGTKQKSIFNATITIGDLKIYLPIMGMLILQGKFLTYPKINIDLLSSFIVISIAVFVMQIPPSPGWYVWLMPFLSIFFINTFKAHNWLLIFYFVLNLSYLLFFILFHIPEFSELILFTTTINLKLNSSFLRNISFTMLEATMLLTTYASYKFGIKSNSIYKKTSPLLIGVGGDSGSGKTTLLSDLKDILGEKLTILEGDGYHKWERHSGNWQTFTHLNPKANWLHKQADNLMLLKSEKPIYRHDYDHDTGKFTPPKEIKPNNFIALSGLHPFYLPKTRKIIDLKIYLEPSEQIRCMWKISRDTGKRGYTKEKVLEQINKRKPDANKYINPQKDFADLVVQYSTKNKSVHAQLTLNSNFKIDPIIQTLTKENFPFEWGYSDNLQHQYLSLKQFLDEDKLSKLSKQVIKNLEEITSTPIKWAPKYRGTIQFIVLFALSEKMKQKNLCEI